MFTPKTKIGAMENKPVDREGANEQLPVFDNMIAEQITRFYPATLVGQILRTNNGRTIGFNIDGIDVIFKERNNKTFDVEARYRACRKGTRLTRHQTDDLNDELSSYFYEEKQSRPHLDCDVQPRFHWHKTIEIEGDNGSLVLYHTFRLKHNSFDILLERGLLKFEDLIGILMDTVTFARINVRECERANIRSMRRLANQSRWESMRKTMLRKPVFGWLSNV